MITTEYKGKTFQLVQSDFGAFENPCDHCALQNDGCIEADPFFQCFEIENGVFKEISQ